MKFPLFCWIGGRQLLPHCKTATRKAASVFWSPDRDRHLEVTGKQQDLWQATAERRWSNKASLNFFSRHRAIGNISRHWEHTYWRLWALWGNPHTWFWHHHSNTLSKHLRSAELTAVPTLPPEKQETFNFCQTVGNYWVVVTQLYKAHSRLQVTLAWFPQQKKNLLLIIKLKEFPVMCSNLPEFLRGGVAEDCWWVERKKLHFVCASIVWKMKQRKRNTEKETGNKVQVLWSVFADEEILPCRNSVVSINILNFNYLNQFLLIVETQSLKNRTGAYLWRGMNSDQGQLSAVGSYRNMIKQHSSICCVAPVSTGVKDAVTEMRR